MSNTYTFDWKSLKDIKTELFSLIESTQANTAWNWNALLFEFILWYSQYLWAANIDINLIDWGSSNDRVSGVNFSFLFSWMRQSIVYPLNREDPKQKSFYLAFCSYIWNQIGKDLDSRTHNGGSFIYTLNWEKKSYRVSFLSTPLEYSVSIRWFNNKTKGINELWYDARKIEVFQEAAKQKQWYILVAWPTGSWKSTLLKAIVGTINPFERKIVTAEDPVEESIYGVTQVSINNEQGVTYQNTLKEFLRQSPEVIMVWEIRDFEVADLTSMMANTWHLLFSTLHTKSAIGIIHQLESFGLSKQQIIQSVTMLISQRLAPVACSVCSSKKQVDPKILEILNRDYKYLKKYPSLNERLEKGFTVLERNHIGCSSCRFGIERLMPVNEIIPFKKEYRDIYSRVWYHWLEETLLQLKETTSKKEYFNYKDEIVIQFLQWKVYEEDLLTNISEL